MPFNKTEVEIHDNYAVREVDPQWLSENVRSPKHLLLDETDCILCRACEDVCPWNCIFMMSPRIVEDADDGSVRALVDRSDAVFIVDDNACTRCAVCVERCPTDVLYFARLPGEPAGMRHLANVPVGQRQPEAGVRGSGAMPEGPS